MSERRRRRVRLALTALSAAFVGSILLWEHTHGGVVTHTVMARDDMPGLSNWWGGLLLPALAWFLLGRIQQRTVQHKRPAAAPAQSWIVLAGFAGAVVFGVLLSVFFVTGREDLTSGMAMALVPIALLFPIYRAEYVLGFVLAMTFTFGAILPTVFACLVAPVAWLVRRIVHPLLAAIARWVKPARALPARGNHRSAP